MAALAGCAASPRAALQRWNGRERRRHARSRRAARLAALRASMGVAPAWAHAVARTRHYQRPKNSRGRARRAAVSRPLAASPLEARAAAALARRGLPTSVIKSLRGIPIKGSHDMMKAPRCVS
jgi:hypothetical protein